MFIAITIPIFALGPRYVFHYHYIITFKGIYDVIFYPTFNHCVIFPN